MDSTPAGCLWLATAPAAVSPIGKNNFPVSQLFFSFLFVGNRQLHKPPEHTHPKTNGFQRLYCQ